MRKLPSLRRHKRTSQAVVTLSGQDHYLGVLPPERKSAPPAIPRGYERRIAEWLASDRRPPGTACRPENSWSAGSPLDSPSAAQALTVAELLAAYWNHAETYYRKRDGSPSPELDCLRAAFGPLRRLYDDLPAREFTPKNPPGTNKQGRSLPQRGAGTPCLGGDAAAVGSPANQGNTSGGRSLTNWLSN